MHQREADKVELLAPGNSIVLAAEPGWKRGLFALLALAIVAGFAFFLHAFFAPAPGRPGIDENAYLLGGQNIAEYHTVGWKPVNDYEFVGHMWFRTKDEVHEITWLPSPLRKLLSVHTEAGWYYPKYPAGLPLLNAAMVWIGGIQHREWTFAVSPACMCLALLGMFLLARRIVGSFLALLAMLVLGFVPTSLLLMELPNSHAPALCFVVWGMFFLISWWQTGSWWRGLLGGFLLGYAVTIRYSEALLLFPFYSLDQIFADSMKTMPHALATLIKVARFLPVGPVGLAAMMRVRWRSWRTYLPSAVPVIGWAIPVGLLITYNWFSTGQMTGYDATHESAGFSAATFLDKWDFAVLQLYLYGLFLFLPLGITGLLLMFRANGRLALLLFMWFLPGTLLYTAYYWGDRVPGTAFLRFFLTIFPPLIIGAMWLIRSATIGAMLTRRRFGSISAPIAAGVLTAATVAIGLSTSLGDMNRQFRGNLNLHYSLTHLRSHLSPKSQRPVIFADNGLFPMFLQYAQFMIDADWYQTDVFEPRAGGGFGLLGMFQDKSDQNAPVLLQQDRIDYIDSVRKGKTDSDFIADQHNIMTAALRAGRPVYLLTNPDDADYFKARFITTAYHTKKLDHWEEPCKVTFPSGGEQNRLGLPSWSGEPFIHWQPQKLNLYEISMTPTTQPAQPSSQHAR